MSPQNLLMSPTYDLRLVALSLLIAILASYVALDLAGRTTFARGRARRWWLLGGAISMGVGIWSMHYIGMLAFSLPVPVLYDAPLVLVSLVAACLASWVALLVVSRATMSTSSVLAGSVTMGSGIGAMHYIGMYAMRMTASTHWNVPVVLLSVVLAVTVSFVALRLTFHFRTEVRSFAPWKVATAGVMGVAVVVMHFTGMAAASFHHATTSVDLSHAVRISSLGVWGIAIVTFMVLALAIVTGVMDRMISAQAVELRRSEERYRQLFERSLAGVFRSTPCGELLDCNDAFAHIVGYPSRRECLEHRATDAYASAAEREAFLVRLRQEKRLSDFENVLRRPDGTEIWVLETASLVDDNGREVIEGTLIDITERKQVEEALRHSEMQLLKEIGERERVEVALRLKQKLESVGQLAAGIAHEINTPVQYVGDSMHFLRGAVDDLRKILDAYRSAFGADDAAARLAEITAQLREAEDEIDLAYLYDSVPQAFDRVFDGIERVAAIVRAVKEFGRPDSREPALADINKAIQSTVVVSRGEWKYAAEVDLALAELPMVRCYVGDLNQVFLNLLVNGAHAIESANRAAGRSELGHIRITTEVSGDHVVISVTDSGTGIPPEIQGRVFDPFFTTKEVGRGTGQGLAISRTIVVDKHGGSLDFKTKVGEGTTFFVRIPIDGRQALEIAA